MRSHAEKVAYTSLTVCIAMILSYLETLLPYIPLPGFKPGFANIATAVALFCLGLPSALSVSLIRILLSSLLFGSPVSLLFSISGGIFTLVVLIIYRAILNKYVGFLGLGVLSSAAHCIGQSIAASALYGVSLLFTYLPWILLLSIPTGLLTGAITYTIVSRIKKLRLGALKSN